MGQGRPRHVPHQPQLDDLREPLPPFIVGVSIPRNVPYRIDYAGKVLPPDVVEQVLAPAAGALYRDQQVDPRLRTIPHVIDKSDLAPDVVVVAAVAVEEDCQGLLRGEAVRFVLSERGRRRQQRRETTARSTPETASAPDPNHCYPSPAHQNANVFQRVRPRRYRLTRSPS